MLTGPLFMLQIYDRVLTSRSLPTLAALAALVFGLFVLYGLFEFARTRLLIRVARRIEEQLSDLSFDSTLKERMKYNMAQGAQPLQDLSTVRKFISSHGLVSLFDLPWAPVYLLVIYLMHPMLGLAACVAVVIMVLIALSNEFLTRTPLANAGDASKRAMTAAAESYENAEVIHVLGMAPAMRERWHDRGNQALNEHSRGMDLSAINISLSRSLRLMFQSAILGLGAWLAVLQEISAGTIVAASIIMARALAPVEQSVSLWPGFLSYRRARKRLKTALAGEVLETSRLQLSEPTGQLSVSELTAELKGKQKPLISDINFEVQSGQILGVVGPSGAGKSTLVRCILGIWQHADGEVRLDGATFDQWNPARLGPHIGYLPQDISLFEGTVAQNIARFYTDACDEKIKAAAKAAAIHDMILGLPDGYNTEIGKGGFGLSVGQRQRVALARALYGSPSLVVLDEPNSNLDVEGEDALVKAIKSLKEQGSSVIVVAHRPSAITLADHLLVMSQGEQIAYGTRDSVMRKHFRRAQTVTTSRRLVLAGSKS